MTTIITREIGPNAKGSPLTNPEMDQNLLNLNNDKIETSVLPTLATLDSPAFTGNPTSTNPPFGDNDTSIATTSFVHANAVIKTGDTKSAQIPAGTTGERDATPQTGAMRFNSTTVGWEGWNGTDWVSIGGGQMYGQASVKAIFYNAQTIAENLTVGTGENGLTAGPVTVNNGFTVTVNNGSTWTIV
jgi:hypothetical protein